ncbi:MAG: hemolysin family protein [Gemmatimonadota bacterium]
MTAAIVALLILINALYVAAEFSAVSVRRSRVRQRAEDGHALARMLLPYIEDPERLDRYIAACQIGITISSLVLGAYGQARLAPMLVPVFADLGGMQDVTAQSTAALVVLLGLTIAQMVLGELVPKSLALQFPTPLALYTALPMKWSLRTLSWFILILNGSGIAILRVLGMRQSSHRHLHSPEEIEYLIAESREGGLLERDEHERLRRALKLGVRPVEDIMIPRVKMVAIDAETPIAELARMASTSPYSRLPVYRKSVDNTIGFVHVQDVVRTSLLEGNARSIDSLLRPILFLPEGLSADRVLQRLREERQHIALVTDEFGGTKGLVTIGDVLDEIFGGIAVEFGRDDSAEAELLPDGRIRIPGSARLDEATLLLGVELKSDTHTLAGLISEALGRIATAGDRVVISGAEFEVERVRSHVVASVIARSPGPQAEDDV